MSGEPAEERILNAIRTIPEGFVRIDMHVARIPPNVRVET